jgi:CAI-1 autoinducer synthase
MSNFDLSSSASIGVYDHTKAGFPWVFDDFSAPTKNQFLKKSDLVQPFEYGFKYSQKPFLLPGFIKKKLALYEEILYAERKNGKTLVVGKNPTSNSAILQNNDYLSIAKHPSIINAQVDTLRNAGKEMVMSAVFMHENCPKSDFEKRFSDYVGYEKAILSQSGWAANVGLLQVIADEATPVYIDFFAHTSLWEGIKSAGAKAIAFKHNDVENLEKQIQKNGPGIILIDSVYSTLGDVAPLKEIANLSDRHGCALVVDESHSLGTHGPNGAGLVAELGIGDKVHFITASLAKAFAGRAGVVFCSNEVARCFPYVSHPAIFSSTLLPHEIAGLSATLDVIIAADRRRKSLHNKAAYFRQGLESLGYYLDSQSQIVSLEPGLESNTELLRDALEERDVFASVFCAPATPKNRALMRFSVNSEITYEQLDHILRVCDEIRDEVGMREWRSTKRRMATLF